MIFACALVSCTGALADTSKTREILVERLEGVETPTPRGVEKTFLRKPVRGTQRRRIEKVSLPRDLDINSAINLYKNSRGVLAVEPNYKYSKYSVSNDSYYTNGNLWGMYSDDMFLRGPSGTSNLFGTQIEQVWGLGYTGSMTTVIGVVDTGIDYTHPDLYLNIYLNQGEIKTLPFYGSLVDVDDDGVITFRDLNSPANVNFSSDFNLNGRIDAGDILQDPRWENGLDGDNNGYIDDLIGWDFVNSDNDPIDDEGHGSHVAGTIGGLGGNALGVAGINWKCQLMPLKFLDEEGYGYLSEAIESIDYYTEATLSQDKLFNNSSPLVYIGTNNSWGGGGFSALLKASIEAGALVNNHFIAAAGNSSSNNNTLPSYPANYSTLPVSGWEAVTSVASIDQTGGLSYFSNFGSSSVDVGAPGSSIFSTTPEGTYSSYSGTSMAAPHVSGTLALLTSSFPSLSRRDLRQIILSSAKVTPSLANKVATAGRIEAMDSFMEALSRVPNNGRTYSLSSQSSVTEGASITFNVTTNSPAGTKIYWSISGIQPTDVSSPLSGVLPVSDNTSLVISITSDLLIEGAESLVLSLYGNPLRTTLMATRSVSINDNTAGISYIWGTTSRDTLVGNGNSNVMTGVPSSGITPASLGSGQVDIVSGGGGADYFLLGQTRSGQARVFYNTGSLASTGSSDYLQIMDFNKQVDKLLLPVNRYFSRNASNNTVIYWDRNNNSVLNLTGSSRDEVIAIIRNVNLGNITITQGNVPWVVMAN